MDNAYLPSTKNGAAIVCEKDCTSRASGVRPMEKCDVQAAEKLINSAFGKTRQNPRFNLRAYVLEVFFDSPIYDPAHGSIVYDAGANRITSVVLALPMRFIAGRERIVARLLCAFASDAKSGAAGAARLSRTMRASQQDLCFTDTSSAVSADHCTAIGGAILSAKSLQWHKALKPFSSVALRLSRRMPFLGFRLVLAIAGLCDNLVDKRNPDQASKRVGGLVTKPVDFETFRQYALSMTERFFVRPEWSAREFNWLISMAQKNKRMGRLSCLAVFDGLDNAIGAALFYGEPGRTIYILNIVTAEGREHEVLNQLFCHFADEGYAHVTGMSQTFLMNALCRQERMTFRFRGYFCITTRSEELRSRAVRGDIYIGGLASESWSRLMTEY
ncbi:GNAT family N-acetyltransferase [Agrobacterium tumefaciens]|uniref:GNAT family N-acetyltransferase n=1 Tax=Agrobacterium tumefaciens TaxID=358 RepID=UPI003BA011E9